jgi:hypothetical protein
MDGLPADLRRWWRSASVTFPHEWIKMRALEQAAAMVLHAPTSTG